MNLNLIIGFCMVGLVVFNAYMGLTGSSISANYFSWFGAGFCAAAAFVNFLIGAIIGVMNNK